MWWKQERNVTGFVALSNVSSQTVNATIQVSDNGGTILGEHLLSVSPHGTKTVSVPELLTASSTVGGFRVAYRGSEEGIIINGGLEDEASGYSDIVPFGPAPDPAAKLKSSTFAELGLMTGAADPMMLFPVGTSFSPYSVLRNISDQPVTVVPTLWWMEGAAARSASGQPLTMPPQQTQMLDTASLLSGAGLKNFNGSFNLTLELQGKEGGVLLASGSVDQKNTYVFGATPRGILESASKSLAYWGTGNGDDTMVTLWNPADEAQDLVFTLYFVGGHYKLPVHLEARASRVFNVSEIFQSQVPDAEGNIIPAGVHEGSAKIAGTLGENQDILVAMDAGIYNVRKATCGLICATCDGWTSGAMSPIGLTLMLGATAQLTPQATWNTGYVDNVAGNWYSDASSIATPDIYGLVRAVGAGQTSVGMNTSEPVYGYTCSLNYPCPNYSPFGASAAVKVNDPTPVVQSVSPNVWNAGAITQVTIGGTGFGTAPTLTISDSSIGVQITNSGDTQITANVTVPASAPNETVTVTVTSTGYNGSGFIGGPGQSNSGSNTATVNAFTAPAPRILFNGTDVTGTTQNVVVGQQIALTTSVNLPNGVAITGDNWSVPGTVVGGYVNAAGNGPPDTTGGYRAVVVYGNSSITFYWVSPGQSMAVTYSYCVNTGSCSPAATATFNVEGPTGGPMTATPGTVNVWPTGTANGGNSTTPWLEFGTRAIGNLGMNFVATATPPSDNAGAFSWVQLVGDNSWQFRTNPSSAPQTFGTGLDNTYPTQTQALPVPMTARAFRWTPLVRLRRGRHLRLSMQQCICSGLQEQRQGVRAVFVLFRSRLGMWRGSLMEMRSRR
jgi:hypothetical protein